MKVLVVLTQPPLPEGGAPGRCAVALLRGLRGNGVDIQAIAARQHDAVPGNPPEDLPVEIVDVARPPRGWSARADKLRRPRGYLSRGGFGDRVRELARSADALHLEETATGWCDAGSGLPPSLVHVHFAIRHDRSLPPPWRKDFLWVTELALAERLAARRHRFLVANSPVIAAHLRRLAPRAHVVVAPLSLDPVYYGRAPLDGPPVAGIIGTATWVPTADAVRRLVERIWPDVRRQVPGAVLRVAGRRMDTLGLAGADGVETVGEVESAASFFRDLSLLLYPIERGSGMKVKVLEALASGVPVVTTRFGAEGVDGGDGVVVESEDEKLVAAAVAILRDDAERRQRGDAAHQAFLQRYVPHVATRPLVELYGCMAAR